ncbi:hypothetical protein [Serratia fonticola]|uniref:hypothetical protein n=1 Tax=Serratia fonticola TaxID=47917 RepID=UPI00192B3241|nr:hypothetical protein [Serratia fonticola]MBL5906872.1 hypothetical protein [Serratia fonticola]
MVTNRSFFIVFVLMVLSLSPLLLKSYNTYHEDNFSCHATVRVQREKSLLNLTLFYTFKSGEGQAEVTGALFSVGKSAVKLSRKFTFSYQRQGDTFALFSNETFANTPLVEMLQPLVPDFYLLRGRGYQTEIYRLTTGNYLFVADNIPVFYCLTNKNN